MSGATSLSPAGAALIERFEGGRSADGLFHAYWDPNGHVWTIGFGQTHNVHPGMTWTLEQATEDLKNTFARDYAPAINGLGIELNQNQFDALASLVWNVGPGVVDDPAVYSMARDLKNKDYKLASADFMHYVNAGGVRLQGLVTRREAERKLFDTPVAPPPPPPDPNHYEWFDGTDRTLPNTGKGNERGIVKEYDEKRKHPHLHEERLHTLRVDMAYLAGRIAALGDMKPYHREFRHDGLVARSKGDEVAH